MVQIKDTKAAKEGMALEEFHRMLATEPALAYYAPRQVEAAHEQGALETLLISNELFGSPDIALRRRYVDLVEAVKQLGGAAHVFSSGHVPEIGQLTGIAAILRFSFT